MKANFNIAKNIRNSRSIGLIVLAILFGSLQVWGDTYALVTDASTLASGDQIIIVNDNSSPTVAISTTQASNNRSGTTNFTLSNSKITPGSAVQIITLGTAQKDAKTYWTFSPSSGNYLYAGASNANKLLTKNTLDDNGKWAISISSGTATITAQGTNRPRMRYNPNNGSPLFACYSTSSTTGTLVRIYKKESVAPSTFTVTIAKNQASWGSVDKSSVTGVANNTSIFASSNVLTVGATTVTATPHAQDANYNYAFSSWSGIPAGGKVTADVTVTANFTRTPRTLTNYRTSCSDPSCDEPTAFATTGVTSTSVGLAITDPANTGIYEIYYNMTGVAPSSGTGASATYNTLTPTVTGLASGATYYMWVRAKCDESTKSNWVALTSKTVTTTCGDPSNLSYSDVIHATTGQNGGVTVSWDGAPSNYEIYFNQSGDTPKDGTGASRVADGTKTFDITGLTAGTYYWWVRSNCSSGKGSWIAAGDPFTINGIKVGGTTPVNFGTVNQNDVVADKFITVTGVGLASGTNITATMSSGSPFSLDPTSVEYNASAEHVNISASTATAGTYNQTLTLSYGGTYTATVTVMMTVQAVYTVTYVHHDKGTFSGASTQYVPTNATTITLPTVTDVSCGFYDTFEGWIASNSEYDESDDKPATVYAGGSSYTVTGDVTLRALYSYEDPDAAGYTKITSGVTAGTYLIATDEGSGDKAYAGKSGDNTYGAIENVTVSEDVISSKGDAVEVTITLGTGTNAGKFAIDDGTYWLSSPASNNLTFTANSGAAVYDWELTAAGYIHSLGQNTRYLQYNSGSPRFACYTGTQKYAYLYKKGGSKYCTNPSCVKPVGVHITYNANALDATMSCSTSNRTYKVVDAVNQYPKLASAYTFCDNATRDGYTLVGWNTQANGLGTTYELDHSYSNLPVSGDLDGENWVTLNVYAMWASAVSFNLGNATGGTGVPDVIEADGGFMLPAPTAAQIGTIPCGYSFYGWSENSVSSTQTKPALFMPGTKYTGSARTLYAVYRLAGEGGGDQYYFTFEVDSKTYCITRKHASYDRFVVEETTTGLEFGLDNGYLYYMDNDARVYVYWAGSSTTVTTTSNMPNNNAYKTTFVPGANGTTIVTPATSGRYLQFTGTGSLIDDYDRAYYTTGGTNPTLVEATSYTYATNPSCETTATLAFVTNGGTLNYPDTYDASNYVDLTVGTNVYLPTATYPGEWVFEGWMKGSELPSQDYSPEGMSNFYTVTLNTTTYNAAPAGTTTFYAVYSKTVNDKQFDPVNGGTYKLFAIMSDGTTKKYMPVWDGTQTTLTPVTSCASTGDYTITPGTGVHAGQYQITHGSYTLGVRDDENTQFKNVADTWWNIEASTSGKGTYRITVVGSSNRCLSHGGTGFFGNYTRHDVSNPSQSGYRDMEIGECIYTEYTSTPENIPYITITGSPVKITSTNGERVYAPTKIHIEAHNFSTTRTIHFSATNGFATNPASVNTADNGSYSGDIDIYYQPTTDGDGSIVSSVLTASQIAGPAAEHVEQTFSAIRGRNLPANFVIAVKSGTQWYAMPDDKTTSDVVKAVPIEVNDPDAPTAASLVPHNVEWRLSDVVNSGDRPKDKVYFYEPNKMKDDGITPWNYALYAGSYPTIGTYGQLSGISGSNSHTYEWGLTTSDLCAYTISNANVGKNISINTQGNFGTHASNVVSETLYLLPITAYYVPAEFQVVEWKANSVVVMYLGNAAKASVQVGDNDEGSNQTLEDVKVDHGVYELAASGLTSATFAQLQIVFKNAGGTELQRNYVTIPAIINGNVATSTFESVKDLAESNDVVILKGGKLTSTGTGTPATSYSFANITIYGGGKLDVAAGTKLGVTGSLILRAGGIVDGAYDYVYPQLNLASTATLTNSSGYFYYEYITDYNRWYHLVLPFDARTTSIKYPTEYYGSAVAANNSGSWVIKRYDGATRATGNYNAWVDIESEGEPTPTTVNAGKGYIFWGAPKKVTANGVKDRQAWGIQRISMQKAAATAISEENGDKTITGLGSYSGVSGNSGKNNDQGWNLLGNPYMVNLTGLNSSSLQVGQLVHTSTVPWDGKWEWDNTDPDAGGLRYVTIPDNHFDTYEAQTMAWFTELNPMKTGRTFFVQIAGANTSVLFAASNRASLMPALYAKTEQSVDVETGIVMSDETKKDEVNFWIKDGKTAEYEYNADYPKTMNQTNFNIYGVHSHGDLSWIAISPEIAEGSMAIGYQVPAAGEYTLSLSNTYVSDKIEHLYVTDHAMSPEVTVDLQEAPYAFTVLQAETNNERFTVSIKLKDESPGTTTDINQVDLQSEQPLKFIYQNKMYILRGGVIYDATGKRIKTINK